jgi:2-polyprenyl-3-methyl-5-hydroxy-6-metoxy-1,4-benzoquinol methylase
MKNLSGASAPELNYIKAMSRSPVVEAYSAWTQTSEAEELCLSIAVRSSVDVLDLGCGAGRLANRLRANLRSYVGVDASPEMIEVAVRNEPDLTFLESDVLDYVSATASWDLILLAGNVLDYLQPSERRATLLARCAQWIRPNGYIIGSTHLLPAGSSPGYFSEDYYGAEIQNYRAPMSRVVEDYRYPVADWCYWVARSAQS